MPADAVPEFWFAVCSAVPVSTDVLNVDAGSILRVWILEEPFTIREDREVPASEDCLKVPAQSTVQLTPVVRELLGDKTKLPSAIA